MTKLFITGIAALFLATGIASAAHADITGGRYGEGNAMVGAYLNRLGLSYAAIRYLTSAPPDSIRWLDCKALDDYSIEAIVDPPDGSRKYPCIDGDKMWGRK